MPSHSAIELLILESHPIQYHAPVYRGLNRLRPGQMLVVYATDCSMRGHIDPGFGQRVAWDVPLLDGYPYRVLNNERGKPLNGPFSLHARGIWRLLYKLQPRAVLFTQLAYEFEWVAYTSCLLMSIPIWLRTETQDEAFERGRLKSFARSCIYRLLYAPMARFFYIGELNRQHYLAHGVPAAKLAPSHYCVSDALAGVTTEEKQARRAALRGQLGLGEVDCVVMFFGKLIVKKDPAILLAAWALLPPPVRQRVKVFFVGDGELRGELEEKARTKGSPALFMGFINQHELPDYFLAADIVVLPSRRMGETWGLVVNEALLAGCGVVVSEAVGCGIEFRGLERVRVIPVSDAGRCAQAIAEIAQYRRDFDWARSALESYSVSRAACALANAIAT